MINKIKMVKLITNSSKFIKLNTFIYSNTINFVKNKNILRIEIHSTYYVSVGMTSVKKL